MSGSGILLYPQVSGIIETIVYQETRRLSRLSADKADLEQEIRMACIRALSLYDPSRIGPSPFKFLQTCVRNHMYNLSRGKYVPNNPPCTRCPLWDKETRSCMINEVGCQPIVVYRQHMAVKAALHKPDNVAHETLDTRKGGDVDESFLLDASIRDILPPELIADYDRMVNGYTNLVSLKNRAAIRKAVRNLLRDE